MSYFHNIQCNMKQKALMNLEMQRLPDSKALLNLSFYCGQRQNGTYLLKFNYVWMPQRPVVHDLSLDILINLWKQKERL